MQNITYRVFVNNKNLYFQYKAGKYWSEPTILDSGYCFSPSIAVSPGDFIHVVWRKTEHGGDISRIYYSTTLAPITSDEIRRGRLPEWSDPYEVSYFSIFPTEPASNPSVEAYGEYVYAAWRGPNYDGRFPGDIWRRARNINKPLEDWEEPRNVSETGNNESNHPVMSTDFVTVWHEQVDENNWDIWGRFEPENSAQPIFQTLTPSKYPHINGYWDPNPAVPPTFCCNTIWTEEIAAEIYEVKFDCYRYEYNPHEKKAGLYYAVEICKDTASPYCVERDGYLTYSSYSLDYADEKLKYKLPYLNPQYSYLLRAIVYRTGVGNWIEDIYIDSILSATILSEPYQPETVWITIPNEFYDYDAEIDKEIEKIIGRRALIADLRLYQVESIDSAGSGGGPQSAGNALIQRPKLYQSYPNPAKMRTVIRYSLPVAGKVSLQLYDISGRLVKTLVDEYQNAGSYSLEIGNWKLKMPSGVYFYRLKTDKFSDIKRAVLVR